MEAHVLFHLSCARTLAVHRSATPLADPNPCVHICSLYDSDFSRHEALIPFLATGLVKGEQCVTILHGEGTDEILTELDRRHLDGRRLERMGQLKFVTTRQFYPEHEQLDPATVTAVVRRYIAEAQAASFPGIRFAADMIWGVIAPRAALIEYERQCNLGSFSLPVAGLCQYPRQAFEAKTVRNVLRTHPWVAMEGRLFSNMYYEPPAVFAADQDSDPAIAVMLGNIQRRRGKPL